MLCTLLYRNPFFFCCCLSQPRSHRWDKSRFHRKLFTVPEKLSLAGGGDSLSLTESVGIWVCFSDIRFILIMSVADRYQACGGGGEDVGWGGGGGLTLASCILAVKLFLFLTKVVYYHWRWRENVSFSKHCKCSLSFHFKVCLLRHVKYPHSCHIYKNQIHISRYEERSQRGMCMMCATKLSI